MDHSTTDAKIKEYAAGVPEGQREDFMQDMWVLLLAIQPECPEGSSLASFLNLTLFRARENWVARQKYRSRGEESFDESTAEPDADPAADVQVEANEALRDLVESLRESFEDHEVEVIVDGLRDGLNQKEIAALLGRTPQSLNYHIQKFRFAA